MSKADPPTFKVLDFEGMSLENNVTTKHRMRWCVGDTSYMWTYKTGYAGTTQRKVATTENSAEKGEF